MLVVRLLLSAVVALLFTCQAAPCCGQFNETPKEDSRLGESKTVRYRVGVEVTAVGGACKGLYATIPVPQDWPEQEVLIGEEEISPQVKRVHYRTLDGSAKQMLVEIPLLSSGETARALVTFEIKRRTILAPTETSGYHIPKRAPRDVQSYLGPSPYIESRHPKIRALAKEITAEKETDWDKAEAIYDYVRENVEYKNGDLKGALAALRDGDGDCEELSSLFIALCRAAGIPARTVWIPGHCYPEFYLEDVEKAGHWFPCQAAGARAFGEMPEHRPVLQKGDNFRVPEKPKDRQRYVAEFLTGVPVRGGGKPKVNFVRQPID
jgi:hypothetical protein